MVSYHSVKPAEFYKYISKSPILLIPRRIFNNEKHCPGTGTKSPSAGDSGPDEGGKSG